MTKHAAAILHLAPSLVRGALVPHERATSPNGDIRTGANGEPVQVAALSDAAVVHLGISLGAEPSELAERLRALLGELLDEHDEPRGVPIFPASYALEAQSWAEALEELGEAADWVRVHDDEPAGGMAALLGAFGIDPGQLGAFGIDPTQLGGLDGALAGIDRDELFASAMQMAEQMARSGALGDLAARMSVQPARDAEGTRAQAKPGEAPGQAGWGGLGLDLGALAEQARELLAADPELEMRLRGAMGVPVESEEAVESDAEQVAARPGKPEE